MVRKTITLIGLAVLLLGLTADLAAKEAGYGLLDRFIAFFQTMASPESAGVLNNKSAAGQTMDALMTEAVKARAQGQIDPVFFHRYARLLRVFKLSITDDPSHLLAPVVEAQIGLFIEDITGEKPDLKKSLLGPFADAMAEELLNLQLHLDGLKDRAKLKEAFLRRFSPGVSKK